jgi:hypothetical protein
VWRELFTRAVLGPSSAEAARVNNSRHNVTGAWSRYFFKNHNPTAKIKRRYGGGEKA